MRRIYLAFLDERGYTVRVPVEHSPESDRALAEIFAATEVKRRLTSGIAPPRRLPVWLLLALAATLVSALFLLLVAFWKLPPGV